MGNCSICGNPDPKDLKYHVPNFGELNSSLFTHSIQVYNFLHKRGHIQRLREIDQLGVIKTVYEGAHHSRWEYVMTQLGILHQLCTRRDKRGNKYATGLGLGSDILIKDHTLTGAEILQIWTLLWNTGHLPGTFSTERAILNYANKEKQFNSTIKRGIPSIIKHEFQDIINKEKIFKFHHILTYFLLGRSRRYNAPYDEFIDLLIEVLYRFTFSDEYDRCNKNSKFKRLKEIFRTNRQISYLALDSQYGPVPMSLNLSEIIIDFPNLISELYHENDSQMNNTLSSFEDFLSMNMYHSGEAIRAFGNHSRKIETILKNKEKLIKKRENEKVEDPYSKLTSLDKLLSGKKPYKEEFHAFHPSHRGSKIYGSFNTIFDFREHSHIPTNIKYWLKEYIDFDKEEKLREGYGKTYCNVTYLLEPEEEVLALNLDLYNSCPSPKSLEIIGRYNRDIHNIKTYLLNRADSLSPPAKYREKYVTKEVLKEPIGKALIRTLEHITERNLSFRYQSDRIRTNTISVTGSTKAANKIEDLRIQSAEYEGNLPKSREHEIKALEQSLREIDFKSHLLVSTSAIKVFQQDGNHLTDFDGAAIGLKNKSLYFLLVEAKNRHKGRFAKSKSQLQDALKGLSLKTQKKPDIKRLPGYGAHVLLELDGKV